MSPSICVAIPGGTETGRRTAQAQANTTHDWCHAFARPFDLCVICYTPLDRVVVRKELQIVPGELRCPRCFGKDIVPSLPRGWRDSLMRAVGKIPRHCRFC